MKSRLFITLDIPEFVQNKIIEYRIKLYNDEKIRWEPKNKYHITLKFLGDVKESKIDDIVEQLEIVAQENSEINLAFNRFGLFFRGNDPKILWAGFSYDDKLTELKNQIETALSGFGFPSEKRKYKPHITICRLKGFEDDGKIKTFSKYEFPKIDFRSNSIELIESKLTSKGSEYKILNSFNLS